MAKIIFRGKDVQVEADIRYNIGPVLVTFQSANIGPEAEQGFSARGFAESYTRKAGISVVFFKASRNHWYQTAEMDAAIAAARNAIGTSREITAYGSSMGAYAAIATSEALGTDRVLALSPQYSIDPVKAPFEYRYRKYADRLDFIRDDMEKLANPKSDIYLFYDPFDLDKKHAELFKKTRLNIKEIKVPFGSHPTASIIKASGLLGIVTDGILHGCFLPADFYRSYAKTKRGTEKYWLRFFKYLKDQDRPIYLDMVCREALKRGFNIDQINVWMLTRLRADKEFNAGLDLLASKPKEFFRRDPVVARAAAQLLLAAGRLPAALQFVDAAIERGPVDPRNTETRARILHQMNAVA